MYCCNDLRITPTAGMLAKTFAYHRNITIVATYEILAK
jgi:hypothetical protein